MVSKTVVPPPHILYLTLALSVTVVLKADLAWNPPQRYNNRQWSADPTLEATRLLLKHSFFMPFHLAWDETGKLIEQDMSVKVF